jgi:3-methyladenine DNA glycosylase Tag
MNKIPTFHAAFDDFCPRTVAAYANDLDTHVARLMSDPGIVRNRAKINAVIRNARLVCDIEDDAAFAADGPNAAAGFAKLVEGGSINATDDTVVILTGTGLKTTGFYAEQLGDDGET